jgi:hypothetical protein
VAYATIDELAAALRVTVTAANQATLEACLAAAAAEIDHATDRLTPLDETDPLANRVNVLRGVEWFKSNDAAFGVIGFADTGALQAPKNTFARHAATLVVLKEQWGVA